MTFLLYFFVIISSIDNNFYYMLANKNTLSYYKYQGCIFLVATILPKKTYWKSEKRATSDIHTCTFDLGLMVRIVV